MDKKQEIIHTLVCAYRNRIIRSVDYVIKQGENPYIDPFLYALICEFGEKYRELFLKLK